MIRKALQRILVSTTSQSTYGTAHTEEIIKPLELKSAIQKQHEKFNVQKCMTSPQHYVNQIKENQNSLVHIVEKCIDPNTLIKLKTLNSDFPNGKIFLIKNFPFRGNDDVQYAEMIILALSKSLNMNAFTYKNEHNGRLLHHIVPSKGYENSETGLSSLKKLPPHIECTFDPHRPDWQALYCLVSDSNAKTTFVTTDQIFKMVPPSLCDDLENIGFQPKFEFSPPASHSAGEPSVGPLFYFLPDGSIGTRYSSYRTRGLDEKVDSVLKNLQEIIKNADLDGFTLEAGDVIIWSNQNIVHGRT